MSKQITIHVPDGKRAEWINGVLTLVDEQKVDNRPVTERIKTFTDACNALGDEHPLVKEYLRVADGNIILDDLYAYLKLRIIVAALNEGWEPKFTEDEYRYFPCFYFYTKEEYDKLDDEEKGRCVLRSGGGAYSGSGFVGCGAGGDASRSPPSALGLPSELVNSQPTQVGNSPRNGLTLCLSLALARS